MPLLPSHTLIIATGPLLLSLSGFLIFFPATILSSTTISLLGSSMHVRPAAFIPEPLIPGSARPLTGHTTNPFTSLTRSTKTTSTTPERELLALIGLILAFAAITQIILATPLRYSKSSLTSQKGPNGKTARKSSQALGEQIHTLLSAQTLWQTLAGLHVVLSSTLVLAIYLLKSEKYGSTARTGEGWDLLANDVVFTVGMSDMLFWGYVYTVVKEERREVLEVVERRQVEDAEDEMR